MGIAGFMERVDKNGADLSGLEGRIGDNMMSLMGIGDKVKENADTIDGIEASCKMNSDAIKMNSDTIVELDTKLKDLEAGAMSNMMILADL